MASIPAWVKSIPGSGHDDTLPVPFVCSLVKGFLAVGHVVKGRRQWVGSVRE